MGRWSRRHDPTLLSFHVVPTAVPEPETHATLLAGLGVVAASACRCRSPA